MLSGVDVAGMAAPEAWRVVSSHRRAGALPLIFFSTRLNDGITDENSGNWIHEVTHNPAYLR